MTNWARILQGVLKITGMVSLVNNESLKHKACSDRVVELEAYSEKPKNLDCRGLAVSV